MGMIITVDGPSGAGKGTLCYALAEKLGFALLDSGAIYRVTALAALKRAVDLSDEFQLADLADEIAQSQGQNVKRGLICSGDSFINSEEKIAQIKADFPNVTAVEMEATAIAQVCHAFDVPFVVVRAISDAGDGEASMSFEEFLPLAAKQSSALVLGMIERL